MKIQRLIVSLAFLVGSLMVVGGALAEPASPEFSDALVSVSVDGNPIASGSAVSVLVDGSTYHMWYRTSQGTIGGMYHATSTDGIAFTTTGALSFSVDPFSAGVAPYLYYENVSLVDGEFKIQHWTYNSGSGDFPDYNYNVSISSLGADPNNLVAVHQGPVGPIPGGTYGQTAGSFGILGSDWFGQCGSGQQICKAAFTDGTPPSTASIYPFVLDAQPLFDSLGISSVYINNHGDVIDLGSGSLALYFTLRSDSDGNRANQQVYTALSTDSGATWSSPQPVFTSPSLDGGGFGGNFAHPEVVFDGSGYRLYLSVKRPDGQFVIATTGESDPCSAVCYADAVNGNDANTGADPANAKQTIQAAIDAVDPGGQVRVLPGAYSETASGRYLFDGQGPYQFGLFIGQEKAGISVLGVDASDTPINDFNLLQASVTTNATNNFGTSGIFVEADGVTIQGLEIGPNASRDNKTIEVIGDAITLRYALFDNIPGGGSVYLNDWRFDELNDTSHLQSYTIEANWFDDGTSIDIASGAGYSGPVGGRQIVNNQFTLDGSAFNAISFSGSGTGVPWFVYSVGGAVISGNHFSAGSEQYIRARGNYDNSQFDWAAYWSSNTFDKAAVALAALPFDVREYTYTSGSYVFDHVRRIGATIQGEVNHAQSGDTVLVKSGAYVEQVVIDKSLHLSGESGKLMTFIQAPASVPAASNPNSTIVKVAGAGVSAEIEGFTIQGPGPTGCGSLAYGIFVRDGAEAYIHDNRVLDIRDQPFSGCQNGVAIMVGRAALGTSGSATIADNEIRGYQKNGITVSNTGSTASISGNTITGAGPTATIAQNGIQVSGGAWADISDNAVSLHSYTPGNVTSTGMLLWGADADSSGNELFENQTGIYHIEGSGTHDSNLISGSLAGTGSPYLYGMVVDAPPPGLQPSPLEDNQVGTGDSSPAGETQAFASVLSLQSVAVTNNEFTGDGSSSSFGLGAYGGFGALDIDLYVANNFFTNWGSGLDIYQCTGGGCASGVFSNLLVEKNSLSGNTEYGLINTEAIQVLAERNWWGSITGPAPDGAGDAVSGDVDFSPWLCSGVDTSPSTGFQPLNLTCPFGFTGFFSPIDMVAVNQAKAGQSVPVKWRLTGASGEPVSDPASFAGLYSYPVTCASFSGDPIDVIEEYTSGVFGLQYSGDGYWQFNWKTPKTYANTCRMLYVRFSDGTISPLVPFQFKK